MIASATVQTFLDGQVTTEGGRRGNMNSRRIVAALLTVLITCNAGTASGKAAQASEQRHFSAEEDGVKKPVPIPKAVLATLKRDEHICNVLEYENISAEKIPASWFSASAIHLNRPDQLDLVVMGVGPLRGANVITFWVFAATASGYELVLMAPAHDLTVKNTRWKGYREIELVSMTAVEMSTVLVRFDGERYKEYKARSEHIR